MSFVVRCNSETSRNILMYIKALKLTDYENPTIVGSYIRFLFKSDYNLYNGTSCDIFKFCDAKKYPNIEIKDARTFAAYCKIEKMSLLHKICHEKRYIHHHFMRVHLIASYVAISTLICFRFMLSKIVIKKKVLRFE